MIDINALIKDAMKSGEKQKLNTLKLIKASFLNAQKAEGRGSSSDPLTDAEEVKVLRKMVDDRKKSIESYTTGNRPDLVAQEQAEMDYILTFLPKQASPEEIEAYIKKIGNEYPGELNMSAMKPFRTKVTDKFPGVDGKWLTSVLMPILKK